MTARVRWADVHGRWLAPLIPLFLLSGSGCSSGNAGPKAPADAGGTDGTTSAPDGGGVGPDGGSAPDGGSRSPDGGASSAILQCVPGTCCTSSDCLADQCCNAATHACGTQNCSCTT